MKILSRKREHSGPPPMADDGLPSIRPYDFQLPERLEASEPPEARGLDRDQVRLMVSYRATDRVVHTRFQEIGRFLQEGDLLVINTSGTMNAAVPAERPDGTVLELHLSTHLSDTIWSIELRLPSVEGTKPFDKAIEGEILKLPNGETATLVQPYSRAVGEDRSVRLWIAELSIATGLHEYLDRYGAPIRYRYVRRSWPSSAYQTVYATEMGSAEMPSAGRPFTARLITSLVAQGVRFAPLLLHTGVASLEEHERPYPEWYRVPGATARAVNAARAAGERIIAVGTTVVRALETVTDAKRVTRSGEGWTDVVVTPDWPARAVDGLLTGLHEPRATHLAMLEAIASRAHLRKAYAESLKNSYLWHEFGDLHLLLP